MTILWLLKLGDYGIIFTDKGLHIGRGMSCFLFWMKLSPYIVSKSDRIILKNWRKEWQTWICSDSSNICVVSNIAVQVFEHMHARQFCCVPKATSRFQTNQFALFGSNLFLCLLLRPPKTFTSGIELGQEDSEHFKRLLAHEDKLKEARRLFQKCGQIEDQEDEAWILCYGTVIYTIQVLPRTLQHIIMILCMFWALLVLSDIWEAPGTNSRQIWHPEGLDPHVQTKLDLTV